MNESQIQKFNKSIKENKDCCNLDKLSDNKTYISMFFIIKEIYEYLNLKTKDNILISYLRYSLIRLNEIKNNLTMLKSFLSTSVDDSLN